MFALALALTSGSLASADIEFKSSGPVSIFVDGRQAAQSNPLKHRMSGLEAGVHELRVVGMFGKTLYEAEIDLPDNTITYASWDHGEIKVLSTDWLPREDEAIVDDEPRVTSTLAQYQEQAGRLREAADSYTRALAVQPMSRELKYRRALVLLNVGEHARAESAAAEAQGQHPDDLRFPRLRARAAFSAGERDRAFTMLEEVARRFPRDTQTQFALADMYIDASRGMDGERVLRELVRLEPDNADALNYLGYLLANENRNLDEAIRGMTAAGATWLDLPTNGSAVPFLSRIFVASPYIATVFLIGISIGALGLVRTTTRSVDLLVAWAIVLMLLSSPLSWETYDLLLLVPVASAWTAGEVEVPRSLTVVWLGILVGVASVATATGFYPHLTTLRPALIVRAVFVVILGYFSLAQRRGGRGERSGQHAQGRPGGNRPALGGGSGLAESHWVFE